MTRLPARAIVPIWLARNAALAPRRKWRETGGILERGFWRHISWRHVMTAVPASFRGRLACGEGNPYWRAGSSTNIRNACQRGQAKYNLYFYKLKYYIS